MNFKKVFTNIITFGASGRIEKRYEQYQATYRLAENKNDTFNQERNTALENLSSLAQQRITAAELLTSLDEEYSTLKDRYPVLNSFGSGYLKGHRKLETGFTATDIANNTILGLTHGAMIGIDIAVAASLVTTILSAKTTAIATTKTALMSTLTTSKMAAVGAAGSVKLGGIGLASKGAIGAIVPIALPFVFLSMAFFSHRKANEEIESINFHENQLNNIIRETEIKITECKKIQVSSEEKLGDLTYFSSCIKQEYALFSEVTKQTLNGSNIFHRLIMKICLFFDLPNKKLAALKERKKELEYSCERIHSLIKISIA
ncbi:hypothetical protein [Flavobacterium sp.]|uniref:hypothetical protein n=1 Tax=Flavobacterium sp. TaxID=239 RepID=UPI0039E678F0